jgi:hypothetical protein
MIAAMEEGYTLEDLEPGITVPRVLRFVRDNMIWEGAEAECADCGPKAAMASKLLADGSSSGFTPEMATCCN